jgi:YihY family inner membrane protein
MPWTTSDRVVRLRADHPLVDIGVETLDGWRRHLSGRNASLLSFWFFLSIFPLLLVATTVLGLVLQDNQQLQQDIIDGALADIPVLGAQLQDDPASLSGSVWVLVFGLLGALWSATKAFVGLQGALDDIWEVPVDDRPSMPVQRGRALLGIVIVGGAQLGSMALAAIVRAASLPTIGDLALLASTVMVNVVALLLAYRHLTTFPPSWSVILPGALIGGFAFTLIQHFGTLIVTTITENASDTYGQFALVLGLVTWLGLLAITVLMCGELNAAVRRHRDGALPSTGGDPVTPAA